MQIEGFFATVPAHMKRLWLVAVLCGSVWPALAVEDPADRFLQAYFLIQEGDEADRQADLVKADAKFKAARQMLQNIQAGAPDWNPHIIEYRLKYCEQKLLSYQGRLPAVAPAPAPAPAPPPAAPAAEPVDPARIAELTAELEQAREQIKKLESTQDDLNAKLQEALKEVPVTQTDPRVEKLLEQNKEMAAQLADAQQKVAELSEKTGQLVQLQEQVQQLEADRTRLTAQLKDARTQAESAAQPDPRLAELIEQNQELADQLTAAQKELSAARTDAVATAESAEVQQLRTQLTETTAKLENTARELVAAQRDLSASREEVRTVRQELETARAETTTLRRDYAAMREKLDEAAKNLWAVQQAGQKDAEIIMFLRKENAVLKEIVERRSRFASRPAERAGPSIPELRNWRPRRRAAPPKPAPAPAEEPAVAKLKESATAQLVAEISAPPPPAPPPAAPPPLTASEAKASVPVRPEVPAALATGDAKTKTLLDEARAAIELKDFPAAIAKYQAVLETDSNNLLALSNLGVIHYQQGQLDEAEQHLRRGVALAPNDSESRSLLGVVYLRKGKVEEAFTELTRAVAINPRNAEAHNYLGITLSEKGWAAAAEQEMRKAVELNPQYPDAHFNLAVLYAGQRTPRLELARYHYQKALDLGAKIDAGLEKLLNKTTAPASQ